MSYNSPSAPSDPQVVFDTTEVFSGSAPTTYSILDVSSVVGIIRAVVIMKLEHNAPGTMEAAFRKNGDSELYLPKDGVTTYGGASACVLSAQNVTPDAAYVVCVTDNNGRLEWICDAADTIVITMEAYMVAPT